MIPIYYWVVSKTKVEGSCCRVEEKSKNEK